MYVSKLYRMGFNETFIYYLLLLVSTQMNDLFQLMILSLRSEIDLSPSIYVSSIFPTLFSYKRSTSHKDGTPLSFYKGLFINRFHSQIKL